MRAAMAILAAAAALSGCAPIPHYYWTQPAVDGVLKVEGAPRSGVAVTACLDAGSYAPLAPTAAPKPVVACQHRVATTTDAGGRFRLDGTGRWSPITFFFGDFYWSYGVDVQDGDRRLSWSDLGTGAEPSHVTLDCSVGTELECRRARQPS